MKRVAAILCVFITLSTACGGTDFPMAGHRGQAPSSLERESDGTAHQLETAGRIEEVTRAEPTKAILPKISILGTDGREHTFLIRPTTTMYGPDWKAISLSGLSRNQQVRIRYIAHKDGYMIALSIRPDR
ncbi:MAG TPA: hypothetical protein PLT09_07085 [Deltaproteobacteria bacterium]|nr:hypothetical protein [Deltaproteobacteria bacterium]HPR53672.1 hypothetical protein [Deltaproteobacteria bacterium]HXK47188.1 hypothetical protein [Deltaproteobacteria bacterium]